MSDISSHRLCIRVRPLFLLKQRTKDITIKLIKDTGHGTRQSIDTRSSLSVSTFAMAPTTRPRAAGSMQPADRLCLACAAAIAAIAAISRSGRPRRFPRQRQTWPDLQRPPLRVRGACDPVSSSQNSQGPTRRRSRRHSASSPCAPPPALESQSDVLAV